MLNRVKRILGYIRLHSEEGSKSKARQLWEIFLLAVKLRLSPLEYEAYGFFLKKKSWPVMLTYLSNHEVTVKLRRPLYDSRFLVILNNKLLFNRFYSSFGFPMAKLYGFLNQESGFLPDGTPLTSQDELGAWLSGTQVKEMFIKPVGGLQGFNALVIKDIDGGNFLACGGSSCSKWTAEDLYNHLFRDVPAEKFYFPGYIFEQLIKQHPSLGRINPSSVNTCRILTLKSKDGTIDTPFAFMRFGRAGNHVDNMNQGGVAAAIDMETGALHKGAYNPKWEVGWTSVHPDSGAAIEGFQVPHWEEAKKLAVRAAAVMPGIKSIGWDIAISGEGPLLVEGNSSWNPITLQQVNQGLLTPGNREIFHQYGLKLR